MEKNISFMSLFDCEFYKDTVKNSLSLLLKVSFAFCNASSKQLKLTAVDFSYWSNSIIGSLATVLY